MTLTYYDICQRRIVLKESDNTPKIHSHHNTLHSHSLKINRFPTQNQLQSNLFKMQFTTILASLLSAAAVTTAATFDMRTRQIVCSPGTLECGSLSIAANPVLMECNEEGQLVISEVCEKGCGDFEGVIGCM
ncbi:unnamed protein product [Periconia digitata]|uniref:Uncharacterized protein n=1 Tax=Periconia digitata TaxID=1303443 RepID=A0A9W4U789_9PLEO|nr:unnamed protein product [Periconia digitata]